MSYSRFNHPRRIVTLPAFLIVSIHTREEPERMIPGGQRCPPFFVPSTPSAPDAYKALVSCVV